MASMVRAKAKPRLRTKPRLVIDLREDIVRGMEPLPQGRARVDREKGVIYGVKILGKDSANKRRYTDEARQQAYVERLYEGVAVYEDHPTKPDDPRPVRSKFGRIVNVRMREGEPYGDLEYLKSHPAAELICEAAERMPEQFGLSHNAKGEGDTDENGVFVVHRIVEVRSVDVVTEPATTDGFFEQRQTVKTTIKKLFENSWKKFSRKTTKRPKLAAYMKALLEDSDTMAGEVEGDVPEDHEEALKGGFKASVASIVDGCLESGEDPKECIKKIGELLKAHHKLTGGDDEPEDDMEEEEPKSKGGEEGDDPGKKDAEEQRKRLHELEAKDNARELCEEMQIPCDKVLLEVLVALPDTKARKRFLEREKGKKPSGGARSGAGGDGDRKSKDTMEGAETPEGFMAALLS